MFYVVLRMINAMKVGEHKDKYSKKLSGGTKRKVCTPQYSADVRCLMLCCVCSVVLIFIRYY